MALVQAVATDNGAGSTTVVVTIASSTEGSCLIAIGGGWGSGITGVTDNQSQTWTPALTPTTNTEAAGIWYVPNTVAGVTAVTITWGASHAVDGAVLEESNFATSSPVDVTSKTAQNVFSSGTTWAAVTTGTTSQNDEVAICVTISSAGSDRTLALDSTSTTAGWAGVTGTGFTAGRISGSANPDVFVSRRVLTSTGTIDCSGTNVDPGECQMSIVSFKIVDQTIPRIIVPMQAVSMR